VRSAARKMSFAVLVLVASSILAVLATLLAAPSGAQAEVSAVESNVFGQTTKYEVGWNPMSVTVGNFNGGSRDLAVANHLDSTVSILLGRRDGTFRHTPAPEVGLSPTPAEPVGGNQLPTVIAVGDFNEDGRQDLATSNFAPGNVGAVSILLGKGDGRFEPGMHVRFPFSYARPNSIASGDFNRDGHGDLATVAGGRADVLLGDGSGTFEHAQVFATGADPLFLAAGRFNRDRASDLAIPNQDDFPGTVTVALSSGAVGCT
jgi:hypothetical protein